MKLRIVDHLTPEDVAMLQALYSRSAKSVDDHLAEHRHAKSGEFMQRYYVGYGHKSIADCGSTTLFIEDVSLLAAKAIQDWPLYSGQETSTRYIDMSKQRIEDPIDSPGSKRILTEWMRFYTSKQERVTDHVRAQHPRRPAEDEAVYERAVKARTFDILRGFLPAGITTQLSWHTNLRQAGDHLAWLHQHPADELRALARTMSRELHAVYASSGFDYRPPILHSEKDERHVWLAEAASEYTYPVHAESPLEFSSRAEYGNQTDEECDALYARFGFEHADISFNKALLSSRPRGCTLPHWMTDFGQARFEFPLDFGSFRDLQRHRNGVVRMPLLNTEWGFEPWYLEQLDDDTRTDAEELIRLQTDRIRSDLGVRPDISATPVEKQYVTALGYRVPCVVTMALPALVYFLELRTQKTVHPTLRRRALEIAGRFREAWPDIALHVDEDPDDWTVRRGTQTIKERV